jgi:hypothetical protein
LLFGLSTNNNALRHGIADLIHEISGLGLLAERYFADDPTNEARAQLSGNGM